MDVNTELARVVIELANDQAHSNLPKLLAMGPQGTSHENEVYTMLFAQPSGEFFALYEPRYKGEAHQLEALNKEQARWLFQELPASNIDMKTFFEVFDYPA